MSNHRKFVGFSESAQHRRPVALGVLAAVLCAAVMSACGGSGGVEGGSGDAAAQVEASVQPPSDLVQPGTLTFGTDFNYPPLEYIEGTQQKGFDVELMEKVAASMGLKKNMLDTRFNSLIPGLEAGRFDAIVSALYITGERARQIDFVPYFKTGQAFVVREGSDFRPQQPEDLCGRTVAVLQGAVVEELANGEIKAACEQAGEPIKVSSLPTDTEASNEVASGRADVLFTDRAVAAFRVKQNPEAGLEVSSSEILFPVAVGIGVPKGDEDTKRAFEEAISHLDDSGELDELLEKYALERIDDETLKDSLNS